MGVIATIECLCQINRWKVIGLISCIDVKAIYKDIPKDLLKKSRDLKNLGICGVCWYPQDAVEVINYLYTNRFVILGGDVIVDTNNELHYTYDNWYVQRRRFETDMLYLNRSKNESIKYISEYINTNKLNYLFTIVYKKLWCSRYDDKMIVLMYSLIKWANIYLI